MFSMAPATLVSQVWSSAHTSVGLICRLASGINTGIKDQHCPKHKIKVGLQNLRTSKMILFRGRHCCQCLPPCNKGRARGIGWKALAKCVRVQNMYTQISLHNKNGSDQLPQTSLVSLQETLCSKLIGVICTL